jgi:signal transduction histidine kinase
MMVPDVRELLKRISALMTVQDIAQELMSELDHMRLLDKILQAAVQELDAETGSLLIWVPPDHLEFAVSDEKRIVGLRIPASQGIAGWVFNNEEPLMVSDKDRDSRWYREMVSGFQTRSLLAVPLMTASERIGVIEVLNKRSGAVFTEQDQGLLTALSAQAATAIVNARLYQELESEKNRLITIEDQTYKKLARDLHDGPAQSLSSIIMDIEFIGRLLEKEPGRVPHELELLRAKAGHTLSQVRTTMFALRPVILETQGLKAALEYYVERIRDTENLRVHLDVRNLDQRLPNRVREVCFAIVHEAVGNVIKHAEAQNVWIVVERRATDLVLAVRDDGKGFDVTQTQAGYDLSGSLGMLNMRERAEMLHARYVVQSTPGRGVLIYLIIPLTAPVARPRAETARASSAPATHSSVLTGPLPPAFAGRRRKGTGPLRLFSQGPPADQRDREGLEAPDSAL